MASWPGGGATLATAGVAQWQRLVAVGWLSRRGKHTVGDGMRWSSSRAATAAALVAGLVVLVAVGRILAVTSSVQRPAVATSPASTAASAPGIPVPDVIAQTLARATTLMRAAGLRGVANDRDPSAPGAIVVAQQPPAGQLVPANSVVGFRTRTDLQPNGTLRRLRMGRGQSTATYPLVAPNPARHRLTVVVHLSRPADLRVWVETGAGTRLPVLQDNGPDQASTCQPAGGQRGPVRCMARFEGLDAEQAGLWSVNLFKRSSPPVGVGVTVTFTAL
jgi:hypothetical protein